MAKRRPTPNYYQRRDAKAQRDAAQRAAARTPQAITERLLKSLDIDHIAHTLTTALNPPPDDQHDPTHTNPHTRPEKPPETHTGPRNTPHDPSNAIGGATTGVQPDESGEA